MISSHFFPEQTFILYFQSSSTRYLMQKIFLFLVVILMNFALNAQKVYKVKYANQADVKVFQVQYENQADLKVFTVEYQNQVGDNNGKWFFTDYANQADKKIFFVDYANQADLKIYYVKYANQAGWRSEEKKSLFE